MTSGALSFFSKATADWFTSSVGMPTKVQQEAWLVIASGEDILVSAPTGTGKTLSAFLVFIDRMKREAEEGTLKEQLYLIYVSPLKSLAGDIRENLRRPLYGILTEGEEIKVAIRTGDTTQSERRGMVKYPPHILITTPESLYLLLTSKSGQKIIGTANAVIIDELHALIDTKRGAHLMFSLARLDKLRGENLQRIGLSATIEPLQTAADYLSADGAVIVAPSMEKQIIIKVIGSMPMVGERKKDPIWEEMAKAVFEQCVGCRSVIAFTEGRRYAEKLAYYVNLLGGEGFARVHHGSISKEQRFETEHALRDGSLRLLCATSSMELGIDVGEIDRVLQVGCPRTVSGTMQRLGRAGHNPGRVSVMYMYPRTAPECLLCGMTAELARRGGVEFAKPPRMCFDILAQHLVSMAVDEGYAVDEVLELTKRTYSFGDVTRQDVKDILCMLAGDYEHAKEIPVRPRVLYDRIHEYVTGDSYSRMLAVHAGGTIPDKGLYVAKNEEGVKLGELDEEFVYESRLGDTFLLGAFAWRILRQDKDTVVVTPAPIEGARVPFWKGELKGRSLRTSLQFAAIMRRLGEAAGDHSLMETLADLGLDESAAGNTEDFIKRQIAVTEILPDDRTILVEHFTDQNGSHQVMVHSLFGRQVNAPLAILMQHTAHNILNGANIGCVDEENGFLLYPYGETVLPDGLLFSIDTERARMVLENILVKTPLFSLNFRYNTARALMMGMKMGGRQPLWLQRLRSTQMMEYLIAYEGHPLIRETRRECLEENWDLDGLMDILQKIHNGQIAVREIYTQTPSPMSLPLQWQIEAAEMYEYTPVTPGIEQVVIKGLEKEIQIKPSAEELERVSERKKLPEDQNQLHSLLMMEGDLIAGEVDIPVQWLKALADEEKAVYIEPGLWIAAEHREEYDKVLTCSDKDAFGHIVRRMLYYRGARCAQEIEERYFLQPEFVGEILGKLCEKETLVEEDGVYYHAKLYDRARKATVRSLRQHAVTQPPEHYAAIRVLKSQINASPKEQLAETLKRCSGKCLPVASWETYFFPRRVRHYGEAMLDSLMAQGEYFWQMTADGNLCFLKYQDIDWDRALEEDMVSLNLEETAMFTELRRRGASFIQTLSSAAAAGNAQAALLSLAEKGLVCADSFVPIRQWQNRDKLKNATVRQRVGSRVMALSAGRWDVVRPVKGKGLDTFLEQLFRETIVLCRETFKEAAFSYAEELKEEISWSKALEILSIWEFTGRARRGYFIKGLSGAQFVRKEDFPLITAVRGEDMIRDADIVWMNAADPDQVWGKVLNHMEGRSFLNVPGTAVALVDGRPEAVLERQGKVLRFFETERMDQVMKAFVTAFQDGRIFSTQKRLVMKEYPDGCGERLKDAGFMKEMQDYVLYR